MFQHQVELNVIHIAPLPPKRIIIKSVIRFDQSSSKFVYTSIREASFVLDGKKFEEDP